VDNREAFEAWATNETLGINMALNVSHVTCARKAYLAACAEKDKVIAELVEALKAIRDHQGGLIKGMPHLSTTWFIANQALTKHEAQGE
jgi:hypothetical protein